MQLASKVHWVGAIDWDIRSCGAYTTPRGTSYNAYLIIDEKVALIDTVKDGFSEELLGRIKEVIPLEKVDYIITQHAENDHAGSILKVKDSLKNAKLVTSAAGAEILKAHFKKDFDAHIVKTGDGLSLGSKTLKFIEAKMLHWPDNMFSFLQEEGILFSNDAFGQHIAANERFADEVQEKIVFEEFSKYYAVIVSVYANLAQKKIREIADLDLDIKMIAPAHGLIWREPGKIINYYDKWSRGETDEKVTVVYDTMWGSTEKMAKAIAKGITDSGFEAKLYNLRKDDWSLAIKDIVTSKAIAVGSPTLNMGIYPTVGGFLTLLKGLRPFKKRAVAFGSYGWGKGSSKEINNYFQQMQFDILESLEIKYVPTEENLNDCSELGAKLALSARDKA